MRTRPVVIWWVGLTLFIPSILFWLAFAIMLPLLIRKGIFVCRLDWQSVRTMHLPLVAAIIGFAVPLHCLRRLRNATWRLSGSLFVGYFALMMIWGIIDVRCEHYQIGGHEYPSGVMVDGHAHYFHYYWTWYFLPYRWIER